MLRHSARQSPGEGRTPIGHVLSVVSHRLDIQGGLVANVVVLPSKQGEGAIALLIGDVDPTLGPVLTRIHSRCTYSESLQSLDCDCSQQLKRALNKIKAEGRGILIYLDQEGRGAGILTKAMAYSLKDTRDLNTFAAYEELGLDPDLRQYSDAVKILRHLRISHVKLMTNNPKKIRGLEDAGIRVTRVPLVVRPTKFTKSYMDAKVLFAGHLIPAAQPVEEHAP